MLRITRSVKSVGALRLVILLAGISTLMRGNASSFPGYPVDTVHAQTLDAPTQSADTYAQSPVGVASVPVNSTSLGPTGEPVSSTVYLPTVSRDYTYHLPFRPLGTVSQIGEPVTCDDQQCITVQVSCAQVSQSRLATLRVGEPISSALRGTILFATGYTGMYFWDGSAISESEFVGPDAEGGRPPMAALSNSADVITHLREAGFRTVQLKWQSNWFRAQSGHVEGKGALACRPATVAKWVYDNLHGADEAQPFCACGHSNGASQVAYMIAQYGLSSVLDLVLLESGPNWSRIDYSCVHDTPAYQSMYGGQGERNTIDWSFGAANDGTGPCAVQDTSFRSVFQEASLAFDAWQYRFPDLLIAFIFGGADTSSTAAHGMYFHDLLVTNNSPYISLQVVPGAPHFVTESEAGAQAIEDTLMNECYLR